MSTNEFMHVSHTNSKLGADIPSINLPAVVTCRKDAPCFKYCYARKGNWRFSSVQQSLQKNLDAYLSNPKLFFDTVITNTALSMAVRWMSSGDIVDGNFLVGMCRVARVNKKTEYLCFTKKYEIVNKFITSGKRIPKNLHIVFSAWENWLPENPYNLPVAYVWSKDFDNSHIPDDAICCGGKCDKCLSCWKLQKGQSIMFNKH